ncbi:MAG: hypothetical protein ACREL5_07065 [Gemmatimonadales bacterium]
MVRPAAARGLFILITVFAMDRYRVIVSLGLASAACGGRGRPPASADTAAMAKQVADSVLAAHTQMAPALLDTARQTMVQLLKHPGTAVFDSLVVTQPAMKDGTWPAPAVCGRLGGKPGVKGARGMTPFIYLNRLTVFVLDRSNVAAFSKLGGELCDGPGVRVLSR